MLDAKDEKLIKDYIDFAFREFMGDASVDDGMSLIIQATLFRGAMHERSSEASRRSEQQFKELTEAIRHFQETQLQDAVNVMKQMVPLVAATIRDDDVRNKVLDLLQDAVNASTNINVEGGKGGDAKGGSVTDGGGDG